MKYDEKIMYVGFALEDWNGCWVHCWDICNWALGLEIAHQMIG